MKLNDICIKLHKNTKKAQRPKVWTFGFLKFFLHFKNLGFSEPHSSPAFEWLNAYYFIYFMYFLNSSFDFTKAIVFKLFGSRQKT